MRSLAYGSSTDWQGIHYILLCLVLGGGGGFCMAHGPWDQENQSSCRKDSGSDTQVGELSTGWCPTSPSQEPLGVTPIGYLAQAGGSTLTSTREDAHGDKEAELSPGR